jgi:hypothetical protein
MYQGKSIEEQQVCACAKAQMQIPDLFLHGTYPLDVGWGIFSIVMALSPEVAYAFYSVTAQVWKAAKPDLTDTLRVASLSEFQRLFLNKGFRVVSEHHDKLFAITKHDEGWYLLSCPRAEFFIKQEVKDGWLRTPPKYAEWPIDL